MKNIILFLLLFCFSLTACDGWSYTLPTFPAPPPTITPSIFTATPVIITITNTTTPSLVTETPTEITTSLTPTKTATAFTETSTQTYTATLPTVSLNIIAEVLGCNTSIDILHGMGEVTNAYVTLENNTSVNIADICTTLNVTDEGRIHPDKSVCVPLLEYGQQVTLKLTVDSTYRVETPIQIEVRSGENLISRVGQESCRDIGLFAPAPGSLLTPIPIE